MNCVYDAQKRALADNDLSRGQEFEPSNARTLLSSNLELIVLYSRVPRGT